MNYDKQNLDVIGMRLTFAKGSRNPYLSFCRLTALAFCLSPLAGCSTIAGWFRSEPVSPPVVETPVKEAPNPVAVPEIAAQPVVVLKPLPDPVVTSKQLSKLLADYTKTWRDEYALRLELAKIGRAHV